MTVIDPRVAVYARVSTRRQEANDLSIPDQVASAEKWVADQGGSLVHTFTEAGSATDDVCREFQAMIAFAEGEDHPIDVILVHSPSRLFRNALHFMQYRERLRRRGVRIVSLTQAFGNDPAADLAVGMLALFDEYHSAENAKHVRRTMIANAANGYWNGHTPPLGFRTVAVKEAKGKDRKRLEHDPEAADVVRLIFYRYLRLSQRPCPRGHKRGRAFRASSQS